MEVSLGSRSQVPELHLCPQGGSKGEWSHHCCHVVGKWRQGSWRNPSTKQQGQQNGQDELWMGAEKALGQTDRDWGREIIYCEH